MLAPSLFRTPSLPTRGLLFIGDPHLWSQKPGRRRDASFRETVLGKLRYAAELSNRLGLWPVFLGDLFHAPKDNDTAMLVDLVQVLQSFQRRPVTLEGNHDKNEVTLSDRNPLTLLEVAGQIEVIQRAGPWAILPLTAEDGRVHPVAIGGTPYGQPLPASFEQAFGFARPAEVGTALWLTHEDLAFEGAYPGALPLQAIGGVEMVVNGHMHGTKLPRQVEGTTYYNPGNITRLSVDMAEHVPAVWEWSPFDAETMASATGVRVRRLIRHDLPHVGAAEIFDFEGRHTRGATQLVSTPAGSAFVALFQQEHAQERTDDASYARASMMHVLDEHEASPDVRGIACRLLEQALERHREATR